MKNEALQIDEYLEKDLPNGLVVSRKNGIFSEQFRHPAANRCKGAPDPQKDRFLINI